MKMKILAFALLAFIVVSGCVEVDTIDVDTDTDTGNENAQQERTDFVGGDIFVKKTVYCEEPATLEGEYCLKPVIGNVTATQLYVGVVAADFACWEQRTGNTISGECEVEIRNDEDEVIYSESFEQKQSVQDCQNDREREMLCGFQFDASIMNPGVYQLDVSYIDQYSGNTMEVKNTEVIIERTLDEQGNAFFDGAFYNFTYPGNWRKSKVGTDLAYQPEPENKFLFVLFQSPQYGKTKEEGMQEIQDSVNIAEGFELLEATTTTLASEEALREKVKYDLDDGTEITQEAIVTVIDGRAFVALFRGQTEKYEEYREGFELIITSFALPGFKIEGGETE